MNALTKDFTDAVEQQFSKMNADVQHALKQAGLAESIALDMEQKMMRGGDGMPAGAKSWGQQFIEAEGLKDFADTTVRPARYRMEVKAITSAGTSGGPLGRTAFRDVPNGLPQRRLQVRDLLPVVRIESGAVEYPRQTARTNNAAMVAEGTLKPESNYGWTMETVTPKVIAHWIPASRQILDDAPQLRDTIDTELLYGLALKEEEQLLNGSGTGENLTGLITNATAYADPLGGGTGLTMLDTMARAILQNALADEPADGIVIHPSDWMRMRLIKDADGKYILGDPAADVAPVLFGLPVVATKAMAADTFLVGNFARAATLYDRWAPRVEVSSEHADFFTRNMVAILAEERLALAPKNSAALTYGDFGNV